MNDLVRQTQAISGRFQNKIKTLVDPLASIYGVNAHAYYRIDSQGGLTHLCNLPEISEFYFSNELYKNSPFLKHPDLVQPGFIFAQAVEDPKFQQAQSQVEQQYQLFNLMLIIEKEGDVLHAHGFATTQQNHNLANVYLNNLDKFRLYCDFFRKETAGLQRSLQDLKVDFGNLIGPQFYKGNNNFNPPCAANSKSEFFHWMNKSQGGLEIFKPLTDREIECLKLMLEGNSAGLIAQRLLITTRTVEHHIDHIKNKLLCSTKAEIFSFIATLEKCGGDLHILQESWH